MAAWLEEDSPLVAKNSVEEANALAAAIEASKNEAQNAESIINEASTSVTNEADKPPENTQ